MPGEISFSEYRSLVRLAALLLYDASSAEEVVEEAFIAVHARRRRPRDREKALPPSAAGSHQLVAAGG